MLETEITVPEPVRWWKRTWVGAVGWIVLGLALAVLAVWVLANVVPSPPGGCGGG